jgi:hypothetical protein
MPYTGFGVACERVFSYFRNPVALYRRGVRCAVRFHRKVAVGWGYARRQVEQVAVQRFESGFEVGGIGVEIDNVCRIGDRKNTPIFASKFPFCPQAPQKGLTSQAGFRKNWCSLWLRV